MPIVTVINFYFTLILNNFRVHIITLITSYRILKKNWWFFQAYYRTYVTVLIAPLLLFIVGAVFRFSCAEDPIPVSCRDLTCFGWKSAHFKYSRRLSQNNTGR